MHLGISSSGKHVGNETEFSENLIHIHEVPSKFDPRVLWYGILRFSNFFISQFSNWEIFFGAKFWNEIEVNHLHTNHKVANNILKRKKYPEAFFPIFKWV